MEAPKCPYCQYLLEGNVSGICPECGHSIPTVASHVFLRWEQGRPIGLAFAFLRTVVTGTIHPWRALHSVHDRLVVPIRQPCLFLGCVGASAVIVSVLAAALETLIPVTVATGSIASGWRGLGMNWCGSSLIPQAVFKSQGVAQLLFATLAGGLTMLWIGRRGQREEFGLWSYCVALAIFYLPVFVLGVALSTTEVVRLSLGLMDCLPIAGWISYFVITAYSCILFFTASVISVASRRIIVVATITHLLLLLGFMHVTVNLAVRIVIIFL